MSRYIRNTIFRCWSGSYADYWKIQPEVLFFGLYSEISGGRMPNKVPGATDYLTVAGATGSETYQAPDTAPYQTADTDYIWFKTDISQRTTTTAELIGYDFTRTIVKYANTTPYAIEAIMILSSDIDTAKMRDDFDLSIWWSNVLSFHGSVKGNKPLAQKYSWTAETVTSYANTGGTGDRTAIITVTKPDNPLPFFGTPSNFVDGNKEATDTYFNATGGVANYRIVFDFGAGVSKIIDEFKFYQGTGGPGQGVWKWQGSNNDSTWEDIGTSFTISSATTQTITSMAGNVTGYRYYRMIGVSGNASNAVFVYEFEFKIA